MTPDEERLDRLALSVADAVAVDWEAARREASDEEERGLVLNLRSLESLASASRGRQAPPALWQGLRLREPLGHGAFGDVYTAWDAKLQREVALKLVPLAQAELSAVALEEGRLLARVRHPHVVSVYGADVSDGWAGLWMERVTHGGERLRSSCARRGRSPSTFFARNGRPSASWCFRPGTRVNRTRWRGRRRTGCERGP